MRGANVPACVCFSLFSCLRFYAQSRSNFLVCASVCSLLADSMGSVEELPELGLVSHPPSQSPQGLV